MSRDTGRTVDSGSPGQMDAEQSKRRHTVKQTRKYTPKLYTIEEVSKEQEEEEEEEYFENEDVEEGEYEEQEDEIEKMRNYGLSEESKEEQREREVAQSEEQVDAGRVLVEEDGGIVGETVEDTRQNVNENVKKADETKEITASNQDAMLYSQQPSKILDVSHRKMQTESTLANTTARHEGYDVTSTSGDVLQQLTRAENAVDGEDEDEIEKPRYGGLGEGNSEEQKNSEEVEEEKSERKLSASEEQVEAGQEVEEKIHKMDEVGKNEDESKKIADSRPYAMVKCQRSANLLDATQKTTKTERMHGESPFTSGVVPAVTKG
ncbi:hypothetical protein AAHC03_022527 [Spirometra sp. Aus1]